MANAYYTEALNDYAKGDIDSVNDTLQVYLVTSSYTFSAAHTQYSDFSSYIIDSGPLASVSVASGGQVDAADTTISSVASGSTIDALIIGKLTAGPTVRPIVYLDSYTNLPAATTGSDVVITWPSYIFEV
jgi:hypothetical protein